MNPLHCACLPLRYATAPVRPDRAIPLCVSSGDQQALDVAATGDTIMACEELIEELADRADSAPALPGVCAAS